MKSLDDIWAELSARAPLPHPRPDFRFDPDHYARSNPDLVPDAEGLRAHYDEAGHAEGRSPTFYAQLRRRHPHIDDALTALVVHEDLARHLEAGTEDAHHLAFELIRLGDPVDTLTADFSMRAYLEWYPDIAAAGMDPLMHYACHGWVEGGRRTLADLRNGMHTGERGFDPARPTVLICVHEMSRTGAPAVGRDLARQASATHNVVVAALRGGQMLDQFLPHCCAALITGNPLHEIAYAPHEGFHRIDFAILNSVETGPFVHPLVAGKIPFAAYLHEYADYTHPAWVMTMTSFADLLVFSSDHVRDSWRGRMRDQEFDIANDSVIIPQHDLVEGDVDKARREAARASLSKALGIDLTDRRIVCGAGHVQWRKGTDIFVQAAQICRDCDPDPVFIWIGDGQNHQDMGFGVWFDYHLRQAGANDRDGNLFFLPAGPLYPDVMDAADSMFLSSRLDPLPNVVFDAARSGCSTVCFEGATGFADARYAMSDRIARVPYCDPSAAVDALLAMPRKSEAPAPRQTQADPRPIFSRISGALRHRLSRQRNFAVGASSIDIPLLFTKSEADRPLRQSEREKLFTYGRRRLWRDLADAEATVAASDNWVHRNLALRPFATMQASAAVPDYAIHIHAFHIDALPGDLSDHAAFARARRIVVTTDTETKADRIRDIGARQGLRIETKLVPNQGRDILPFLQLFGPDCMAGDDMLWCHLHQKKSVQTTTHGDTWRRFLHRVLLGDEERLSSAIEAIASSEVGLVAPFEPHFVGWDDSRRLLPGIADRFGSPLPENPLLFPVGNMFWTRADVATRMLNLFGPNHPWPNEPIPTDGTEFHLIERLWPAMAAEMGMRSIFIHKMDEERI